MLIAALPRRSCLFVHGDEVSPCVNAPLGLVQTRQVLRLLGQSAVIPLFLLPFAPELVDSYWPGFIKW